MKKLIVYLALSTQILSSASLNLQWQSNPPQNKMNWADAIEYCENLLEDGYDNWRVPTITELLSIASNGKSPEVEKYHWSSTTYTYFKKTAWFVNLDDGYRHFSIKTNSHYVKCVRDTTQ